MILKVKSLLMYYFKENNTEFEYYIDNKLYEWHYGDLHNIKHVLVNLLKNAIKYQDTSRKNKIIINVFFKFFKI